VLLLLEPSGFDLHHELQLAQADSGTSQPPNCVGQLILIINLVCERVCVCVLHWFYVSGEAWIKQSDVIIQRREGRTPKHLALSLHSVV
jgi:hypothetical protein